MMSVSRAPPAVLKSPRRALCDDYDDFDDYEILIDIGVAA